jgi:hypothetical protein
MIDNSSICVIKDSNYYIVFVNDKACCNGKDEEIKIYDRVSKKRVYDMKYYDVLRRSDNYRVRVIKYNRDL